MPPASRGDRSFRVQRCTRASRAAWAFSFTTSTPSSVREGVAEGADAGDGARATAGVKRSSWQWTRFQVHGEPSALPALASVDADFHEFVVTGSYITVGDAPPWLAPPPVRSSVTPTPARIRSLASASATSHQARFT